MLTERNTYLVQHKNHFSPVGIFPYIYIYIQNQYKRSLMDCIFFSFVPLFRRSHKKKIIKSVLVECNAKAKIPWMIQQDSERKLSLWIIELMMIILEWNPFINGVQEQGKEYKVKISLSRESLHSFFKIGGNTFCNFYLKL